MQSWHFDPQPHADVDASTPECIALGIGAAALVLVVVGWGLGALAWLGAL